jgi:ABC-type arginine transport system permease subunit
MDTTVLGGLAGLITLFISGAVFGRLHGAKANGTTAIGDRVMCGLLALPLIALAVRFALPGISGRWAVVAPAPLAIYVVLLAATDIKREGSRLKIISNKHFVESLLVSVGFLYIVAAVIAWVVLG